MRDWTNDVICPDCKGERRGADGALCRRCQGTAQIARSTLRPGEVEPFATFITKAADGEKAEK